MDYIVLFNAGPELGIEWRGGLDGRWKLRHPLNEAQLNALDAMADLMIDRARLVQRHRKDLADEQRGAQRDAQNAYHDGFAAGRAEGGNVNW